jgi:hypothetical protein
VPGTKLMITTGGTNVLIKGNGFSISIRGQNLFKPSGLVLTEIGFVEMRQSQASIRH